MRYFDAKSMYRLLALSVFTPALFSCSSDGNSDSNSLSANDVTQLPNSETDISEPAGLYNNHGYGTLDLLNVSITTTTTEGECNSDETDGCSLEDVHSDVDGSDDFKPEINVHFSSDDYPQDELQSNAELKQRGDTSRLAEQKSYSVKLNKDLPRWRDERRLQLNKHPFDQERIRNKLSFDLMRDIDHLNSLRTQFVHLTIEDKGLSQDYGLYTHVEHVGEEYLEKRGYNTDSPLYKTVNFAFTRLADRLQINEDGTPVDEDLFERNLEIKNGDDHRALIAMLEALNNPDADQTHVIDKHFNENNIVTWLAVNILLGNANTVFENYYLYNPKGTERFYYLPWDYDSAFKTENNPDDYQGQEQIRRRSQYGISKWWNSVLIRNWLKQESSYELLKARVKSLRSGVLSSDKINALIDAYRPIIQPVLMAQPDLQYMEGSDDQNKLIEWYAHLNEMPGRVKANYDNFIDSPGWPMTFRLFDPQVDSAIITLSWTPSWDFEGDIISYSLEISDSVDFDNILYRQNAIDHTPEKTAGQEERISIEIDRSQISSGTYYWRVIATDDSDAENHWRPASNRLSVDGSSYYGMSLLELAEL